MQSMIHFIKDSTFLMEWSNYW